MDIKKRIRTNPSIIIAYGLYLYFISSYRFAGKSLEPIIKRTHVSIWKWVQKYSILADRFVIGNRKVQKIFAISVTKNYKRLIQYCKEYIL